MTSHPFPWPPLVDIALAAADPADRFAALALERIRAHGAALNAFLAVPETPIAGAGTRPDAPLQGVPVALKDNLAVAGLPMTCGSRILEGHRPVYHATVVERLLAAGARIVGKTNLDEFAMGSSTETSAHGPARNPWDLGRTPGGSSGGSAAAVAAGLVPAALGSDTGGSVRQPAALCGAVGFKPSYGAVSRYGLVAYGSSLDAVGPIAGTVADAARLFEAIRGADGKDETAYDLPAAPPAADRPLRIGRVREFADHPAVEPAIREALARAVDAARDAGFEIVDLQVPCLDETVLPAYYLTACAEASSNLNRYDGVRYGNRGPVEADDAEGSARSARSLFGFEAKLRILLGTYVLRAGHYDRYYARAQAARRRVAEGLDRVFRDVDLLLTPVFPTRAFRLGEFLDDPVALKLADLFTVPSNLTGGPALALPVGLSDGLPTAVQLMGPRFGDRALLAAAARLEAKLAFPRNACPFLARLETGATA